MCFIDAIEGAQDSDVDAAPDVMHLTLQGTVVNAALEIHVTSQQMFLFQRLCTSGVHMGHI